MSCLRTITLACISLELFPFDFLNTILCLLFSSKTIRDFSMKHGSLIKHDETMCHAQGSLLLLSYLWSYFPLIIFHTISLYNLKIVRDISMKLGTLLKQNDRICDAQELLLAYFGHACRKGGGETSVFT